MKIGMQGIISPAVEWGGVPHWDKSVWGEFRCQGTNSRAIWMRFMLLILDLVWWHHPLWRSFIHFWDPWLPDSSSHSPWHPWATFRPHLNPHLLSPILTRTAHPRTTTSSSSAGKGGENVFIWNSVSQTSHVEDWKYPPCCGEWAFYFWESWAPWFKGKHIPKRD